MTSNYFLDVVMGNVFGSKSNPPLPANYFIGLSTSAPTVAGGNVSEPSASAGYSRVRLTGLNEPSDGIITNSSPVIFEESTADWGVITHFVIFDAETGGNLLMYDELTSPRTIEAAVVVMIKANGIQLTLANPT